MCYTRRKLEGGVGALREFDDANFLKPNGQSRNLHVYGFFFAHSWITIVLSLFNCFVRHHYQYREGALAWTNLFGVLSWLALNAGHGCTVKYLSAYPTDGVLTLQVLWKS